MIERRASFIHELDNICEEISKNGEFNYDKEKFRKSFLEQVSGSPENLECIENIEYSMVMKYLPYNGKYRKFYGLEVKDTGILLSEIAYLLENDEVIDIIMKAYPKLSLEGVNAAQRAITLILLAFECRELEKYYEADDI